MSFVNAKEARPVNDPKALVPFGWAPGGYYCRACATCGEAHSGSDKRSIRCQDCAESLRDAPSPMTPPMTPREKVRQIIDDALNSAIPEPWEVANHATDRIITALASGSGEHAELARELRRADEYQPLGHDGWKAADALESLLAENAALRAIIDSVADKAMDQTDKLLAMHDRATEAERKLAEARLNYEGALSDIDSLLTVLIRRINGEKDLASAAEWVRLNYPLAAEKIISKEAERG